MSISSAIASVGLRRFASTVDMELKEKLIEPEEVCLSIYVLFSTHLLTLIVIKTSFSFSGYKGTKRLGTFKTELT